MILPIFAVISFLVCFSPIFNSALSAKRDHIRDLQSLPVGNLAHLRGVVTYSDPVQKRFWIQDETGAVAIDQDPGKFSIHAGQTINMEGHKSQPYSVLNGPTSVELSTTKIEIVSNRLDIPSPLRVSFKSLPEKEKNGMRVELSGIIHDVVHDSLGRTQIVLAGSGQEIIATVSETKSDISKWINGQVHVIGVSETYYDQNGNLDGHRIWIQTSSDIQLEQPIPASAGLYTIRSLYLDSKKLTAHRIRLQGIVISRQGSNSLLIADHWGAIRCEFKDESDLPVGSRLEIEGFPLLAHRRIDLLHASALQISRQVSGEDYKSLPLLTTIASIRHLNEIKAGEALPIRVTGVITYHDPAWEQLFFQDSTGGIFMKYPGTVEPLKQGEQVTVIGLSNEGDFAPVIVAPRFVAYKKGAMPTAVVVTSKKAISGSVDSKFVSVEGVVHSLKTDEEPQHMTFELSSPLGGVHVEVSPQFVDKERLSHLVDATVRMRGVFSTVFNSRRQLVGYKLSISSIHDIQVLEPAEPNSFQKAVIPINQLLGYSLNTDYSHRVKVRGTVSLVGRGFFYLQDSSGGIEVQSENTKLHVSDNVEAVGYASAGMGYSPILTDAMARVVGKNAAISPSTITADSNSQGQYDSQLVTIDGRLVSVMDSQSGKILLLQLGARTIRAQLDSSDHSELLPPLEEGSILQVTGICSVDVKPNQFYVLLTEDPLNFSLTLRSPRDIKILQAAPWWTVRHALIVIVFFFVAIVIASRWVTTLRRRINDQTFALQKAKEETAAICDLAAAMQEVTLQKNFSGRVAIRGDDEIATLGTEFNKMLAELELRDVAKQQAEEKLQYQALTDELTGLPNRRLLSDRLTQTLAIARRERNIVAVLYIDLDGFKLVNDSLGHMVGDLLLGQVSERLQSRIRQSDTLARLGGDEFTVVLSKLTSKEDAGRVGISLLEALSRPFFIENQEITISGSIGISLFPENGTDGADLLQQADSAMYTAKRNGKNQMMYFTTELGSMVRERLSLENQLRGAIARNEIAVHYQPEFDIVSGHLIRFEALARWTHPTLGTIPPLKFIPIAEESGLIIPFGAYIMERACRDAVIWQNVSPDPVQVAVNVSSLQFMRETFVHELTEILNRTGLKPNLLQIELTESVMLNGAERAAETMKQLRGLGISIAIDDFGTGYSCFSYLPRLPFNSLKIDRSFVKELELRPETKAMVQSLVALAHNLGMQVIVEGIETPEQLAMIQQFGGNEVQGYLLGRPTADPISQLAKLRAPQDLPTNHDEVIKT